MRRLVLLIIALATLLPSLAFSYDVLVLQSRRDPGYDEVLKGFRFEQKTSLRLLVLSDYAEVDLERIVREERPRLILAMGDAALKASNKIRSTPVLAVMTLGVTNSATRANLTGISMHSAPENYMDVFSSMNIRRIGVVHDPARSEWYLRLARTAAKNAGVQLVERTVASPREVPAELTSLAGKVDALWMLPDATAITRETTEAYLFFGQESRVPVISFSAAYLGLGAAAAVDVDRHELGSQADKLAKVILDGKKPAQSLHFPAGTVLKKNDAVLKRLKLGM